MMCSDLTPREIASFKYLDQLELRATEKENELYTLRKEIDRQWASVLHEYDGDAVIRRTRLNLYYDRDDAI